MIKIILLMLVVFAPLVSEELENEKKQPSLRLMILKFDLEGNLLLISLLI